MLMRLGAPVVEASHIKFCSFPLIHQGSALYRAAHDRNRLASVLGALSPHVQRLSEHHAHMHDAQPPSRDISTPSSRIVEAATFQHFRIRKSLLADGR